MALAENLVFSNVAYAITGNLLLYYCLAFFRSPLPMFITLHRPYCTVMMATTHALFAALLASATVFIAPEFTTLAVVAAALGGVFPDFDMPFQHRRTFHYPVYFTVAAAVTGLAAVIHPSEPTVVAAFFFTGAASHALSDMFGGDLGMRPWEQDGDRAVYIHYSDVWVEPRRWIRYDGSPEDFLLGLVLAAPLLWLHDGILQHLTVLTVGASFVYMVVRKRLVAWREWIEEKLDITIPI